MRVPRTGSIYLRGRVWWIKFYHHGQPFRESSHSTNYLDAERLLKRRQGETVTGVFAGLGPERIKIQDLFRVVIQDYEDNDRATLYDVSLRIKKHLTPAFGELRAAALSTHHVRRYIARRKREATNATINRELALLKRAFHLAFHADPPMVVRIPYIATLKERNVRRGFLDHTAYVTLRDELPNYLRLLYVVAYHVGCRKGELKRVQWPQVDLAAGRIMLHPGETKNDEPRTLPIYGEMREWLLMAKEERDLHYPGCPWVFHKDGKPIGDFRKAWASACQRAGVDGLLFHDLRRSAVRNMERAGIPRNVAMAISGHKTESVYRRYDIVAERDLVEAAGRMERHLESLGTITGTVEAKKEGKVCGDDAKLLN